jgi:creatinine amidohydrolase
MTRKTLVVVALGLMLGANAFAKDKALILQEMSWPEVKDYLKKSDMIIIPLGSTEQHGPHLPLGTDYYSALEMSKKVSAKTGMVVAPLLWLGYCKHHMGFAGTINISHETMEQFLFESVQSLIQHGFKRFLFFNWHGGNNIIQSKLIHRINSTTQVVAIAIGYGSPIQKREEKKEDFFDWHAGVNETSIMLHLKPGLVRMDRARKPEIRFTPRMKKLMKLFSKNPDIQYVWDTFMGVPVETKKGGASHELSSNGVWSFSDPRNATRKRGEKLVDQMVEKAVRLINDLKSI